MINVKKMDALAAARLHRRRVCKWLKVDCVGEQRLEGSYSLDDAVSDLCGCLIENGWESDNPVHVRRALRTLRSRPFGYEKPDPVRGSADADFVELATLLIESTRDAEIEALGTSKDDRLRKHEIASAAAFSRSVIVDHGRRMVGEDVLIEHLRLRSWSARQFVAAIQTNCRRVVSELSRRRRLAALLASR